MNKNKISICIPYFNEADEIVNLINDILNLDLNSQDLIMNYIFIDDCSNDNTTIKLKNILQYNNEIYSKCIFIKNNFNIGYSSSLIKGFKNSNSEFTLTIPGDGEILISKILPKIKYNFDLIIFERINMFRIRQLNRLIISYFFRLIITIFLGTNFKDTNGLFVIKTEIIQQLNLNSKSFFLNAEVIAKCIHLKKNITFENIELEKKKNYKSLFLNFRQFRLLIKNFLKTIKFVYAKKKN